jgi:hypothetical protein
MAASSTTGVGLGDSSKFTTKELSALANGPSIYLAGSIDTAGEDAPLSPPSGYIATVTFPNALPNGSENYVVMLTTQNAGSAYVTSMNEDANEKFSGFTLISESDGVVMYLVVSTGARPIL